MRRRLRWTAGLALLLLAGAATAGELRVRLIDAVSTAPLIGQAVAVHERLAGGTTAWRQTGGTGVDGVATFDLAGLGSGRTYELRASPFGPRVTSAPVTQSGLFHFEVGRLQLEAVSGADGQPLVGAVLQLRRRAPDGSDQTVMTEVADAGGRVRLDPPTLPAGHAWVIRTPSPVDGSTKDSPLFTTLGAHRFVVGNAPLTVHLLDGIGGQPLPGQAVTVHEVLASGALVWHRKAGTDAAGRLVLDLDGLGHGRTYVLKATPFGPTATSAPITATGALDFPVGRLRIDVVDGIGGGPLVGVAVQLKRRLTNGSLEHVVTAVTPAGGELRLDPPPLGAGQAWVARAASPADGTWKESAPMTALGTHRFEVGSVPLLARLRDHLSRAPLADTTVTVYERLATGDEQWRRRGETNAAGELVLDLDGLGDGRTYVLKAAPYGLNVASPPITAPGTIDLTYGAVPVTLIDRRTGGALSNRTLVALQKLPTGELRWERSAVTDATGTVRFDPALLEAGGVYLFRAVNPFGGSTSYYSGYVTAPGPVTFTVGPGDDNRLDRTVPVVTLVQPQGPQVSARGFTMSGYATDGGGVTAVVIEVTERSGAIRRVEASYDPASARWSGWIPGGALTADTFVLVTVRAQDASFNVGTASGMYRVIEDGDPPVVEIASPRSGSTVPTLGFRLSGQVTDATHLKSLRARIVTDVKETTIGIEVDAAGRWATSVRRGVVQGATRATVVVTARDSHDNEGTAAIEIAVAGKDSLAQRVLERTTFGPVPGLLEEIEAVGPLAFLEEQLDPAGIDDSAFEVAFGAASASGPPQNIAQLQDHVLQRAIHSRRQLEHVMTVFWDNHFNTYPSSSAFEIAEHEGFRAHALGRFRDLLAVSAKSPAMLNYLDLTRSRRQAPNENYPRELLELHTMGSRGGYTQQDVEEIARALTGWRILDGAFAFEPGWHDYDEKLVLGVTLPAGYGQEDGERVLDLLAAHPSTARHICGKLVELLVSDARPAAAVDACAATFLAETDAPDQIAEVLRTLFHGPDFAAAAHWGAKVRTPLELVAALGRIVGRESAFRDLRLALERLEMPLFRNPVPTGYPEQGDAWVNPSQLLQRLAIASEIVMDSKRTDVIALVQGRTPETADGVLAYLFELVLGEQPTWGEWVTARDVLTVSGSRGFDLAAPDADARLRRTLAAILGMPAFSLQ